MEDGGDFGTKRTRESCIQRARLPVAKRDAVAKIGKDNPFGILFGNRKAGQCAALSVKNDIGTIIDRWRETRRRILVVGDRGPRARNQNMQDAMNLLMLICATLASLAFGVLVAYGVCRGAFAMLRQHAGLIAAERAKAKMDPVSQQ